MPRLLYLVTEDWFFHSHFLPMARAAREQGLEVVVAARCSEHRAAIEREGIRVVPLGWRRSGEGPVAALRGFFAVHRLLRRERPDLLHCIALKPILVGGLAARIAGRPPTVCAVTGLGRTWIPGGFRRRMLRTAIGRALWLVARDPAVRVVVENRDHERALASAGIAPPDRIVRVPGAGVDLARYRVVGRDERGAPPVVALVARMIAIKGIEVAVEAVTRLAARGVDVRLWLVGLPDRGHRGAIDEERLRAWSRHPSICWLGWCNDVPALWGKADIALLPSLGGDGLPKSLIEAAACGRPIITTDTDGCREAVRDGVSGYVVPPGNAEALAQALARLVGDSELRKSMGRESRRLAEAEFSETTVAAIVADLYRSLLPGRGVDQHRSAEVRP